MAKIEKVTVLCDGPCGGNEITGDPESFVIRRGTEQNRRVDLCNDCAGLVIEMYAKGTTQRSGRPTKTLARTAGGQVEPVEVVGSKGATPVDLAADPTPVVPVAVAPVVDPFTEAPVGTGV